MRRAARHDGMAWVMLAGLLCLGAIVVTAICAEGGVSPSTAPLARALDWQAALGLREPWRLFTAAWVHWNLAHLAVNLAGGAVVAFVGWRARIESAAAWAWLAAWPLTQVAMAALGAERVAAAMPHYGGLSGVLHAGVVVLGLTLAWPLARVRAQVPASATGAPPLSRMDAGFVATRITEGPWAMTEMGAVTAASTSTLDQAPGVAILAMERPLSERWIGVAIVAGTLLKVVSESPWDLVPRASAALGIAVAPVAHACGIVAGGVAWGVARGVMRRR